jgi:hypothetical protein
MTIYQIRVKGHLEPQRSAWFDGMTITNEENGEATLTGAVCDQAALHGLLLKVQNLNLTLISLTPVEPSIPPDDLTPAPTAEPNWPFASNHYVSD